MDTKFDALVDYLLKELEGHKNAIKHAREQKYAGYKSTIQSRKIDIIKIKNILKEAERISGKQIIPEEEPDNTLYWDELKYDDMVRLVKEGKSDADIAQMYGVIPKTVEKKRLQWRIRRDKYEYC